MTQKTVLIAGFIGLLFGVLFAGTLGLNFFGTNNGTRDDLKKDVEGFKIAYNLDDSIYIPIYGDDVQDKLDNGETFILYLGRDTCPYCQQYVPNLQEAAQNQGFTEIYHVDTIDKSNKAYINQEGVNVTPTTYIIKDGVIVEIIIGFKTVAQTEQLLIDSLS